MSITTPTNRADIVMQEWRLWVQTRLMAFGALLAFPAVIQTVWRAARFPQERYSALILVLLYLGIIVLAFQRRIPVSRRSRNNTSRTSS